MKRLTGFYTPVLAAVLLAFGWSDITGGSVVLGIIFMLFGAFMAVTWIREKVELRRRSGTEAERSPDEEVKRKK